MGTLNARLTGDLNELGSVNWMRKAIEDCDATWEIPMSSNKLPEVVVGSASGYS